MQNKISIILCSYNEVKYIENTINQLEKHIPNLELVIVDDSSNDGTIELLKKLNTNNRFKLIFRKKSKGLASAFSVALLLGFFEALLFPSPFSWSLGGGSFAPLPFCITAAAGRQCGNAGRSSASQRTARPRSAALLGRVRAG